MTCIVSSMSLFILWLCFSLPIAVAASFSPVLSGTVTHVRDGDTLVVDGKLVIRLAGIDAPERRQTAGELATQFVRALVDGHLVTVIVERSRDKYGRMLGDVRIAGEEGQSLRVALVEAGLAWCYMARADWRKTCATHEAEARRAARGLWGLACRVPPWLWRKGQRC